MDSAIATITEQGAIYRGVNCIDLAEKDTLEHTATLLWDVTVDPFAAGLEDGLGIRPRAVENERNLEGLADGAEERQPVHGLHHVVRQHDIVGSFFELRLRLDAIGRGIHVVALPLEEGPDEDLDGRFVVDY